MPRPLPPGRAPWPKRKTPHPNIYKCRRPKERGGCGHWWIPEPPHDDLPSTTNCEKCGYTARLRCGVGPREQNERSVALAAEKGIKLRTEPCGMLVAKWGDRCYVHGARNLKGSAHSSFDRGQTSKYMPAPLADLFEQALQDPNLKTLDETFALLSVRRIEALKQLSTDHARCWEEGLAAAEAVQACADMDSMAGVRETLPVLLDALRNGAKAEERQDKAWTTILDTERQRAQAVGIEARRMQAQQGVIPLQQYVAFQYALLKMLEEFLPPAQLSEFQVRLRSLGDGSTTVH